MSAATGRLLPGSRAAARRTVNSLRGRKIVVLGDVMLDRYVEGEVSRISPEAPVPVVALEHEELRLGGAGNVARNVAALGGEAVLVSVVGDDTAARRLRDLLNRDGISSRGLVVDATRPTSVKTRVIAGGQQIVRIDREKAHDAVEPVRRRLVAAVRSALSGADGMVISDYGKGVVTASLLDVVVPFAVARGVVAVDPKESHFDLYRGVTVITPNHHEASFIAGTRIKDEASLLSVGERLRERVGAKSVLITRGRDGMSLFEERRVTHIPAATREVFDVTGAGDTVVSTVALALAAGLDLPRACAVANAAAGVAVARMGAAAVSPDDLVDAIVDARRG